MSLFNRYDQNETELFLDSKYFVSTPQFQYEDLFKQIHQHYPHAELFSTDDDYLKDRKDMKNIHEKNVTSIGLFNFFKTEIS